MTRDWATLEATGILEILHETSGASLATRTEWLAAKLRAINMARRDPSLAPETPFNPRGMWQCELCERWNDFDIWPCECEEEIHAQAHEKSTAEA